MILHALRTTLRGWLQDTVASGQGQWTDAQLDRYINLALRETEKHILSFDPDAFKCEYLTPTTVPDEGKDNKYSYPVGTVAVHEIALSSDGVHYTPLQRLALKNVRDAQKNGWTIQGFIPFDAKHFVLWPSATQVISNGLRITVAPTLVIADDTNKSPLPAGFETLNLKHAQLFALWDVGEPTDKVQDEVDALKKETPRFYLTASEPAFLAPVIDRGY